MIPGTRMEQPARYAKPMIILHWGIFLLMIGVFASIELRVLFEKGTEARELAKSIHFMLGLSVLLLAIIRLKFKFGSTTPPIQPPSGVFISWLARLGHLLLYVIIIGLPLAGWMTLSAAGKPISFWGLELPPLLAENKELAKTIKDCHKLVGNLAYYLIGAHVLIALFHHYIRRDNTLRRMLPW